MLKVSAHFVIDLNQCTESSVTMANAEVLSASIFTVAVREIVETLKLSEALIVCTWFKAGRAGTTYLARKAEQAAAEAAAAAAAATSCQSSPGDQMDPSRRPQETGPVGSRSNVAIPYPGPGHVTLS